MEVIGRHKTREIISVRIDPGECLTRTIENAMKEVGGNAVVITAVGSLSKLVVYHPESLDKQQLKVAKKEMDGPFEIVSLVGTVGPAHRHEDRMSHMHIAVSQHNGPVIGGILGYGSNAWFPVEVYLLAYE